VRDGEGSVSKKLVYIRPREYFIASFMPPELNIFLRIGRMASIQVSKKKNTSRQ